MAKELLLMADVEGLGSLGAVVRVREGFARNYLLPKGLAAPITEATRRRLQKLQAVSLAESAAKLSSARELAARIEKVSCTLPVKTGEGDKLFGAVTSQNVADVLKAQGIEIDRRQVEMEQPIHELGVFQIPVRLHSDLTISLKVWVVKE